MSLLERRVPVGRAIALLAVCGSLLAFAAISTVGVDRSSAFCSGNSCLPVGGYTLDTVFDCGQILTAICYANGTTSQGSAVLHHFGWASSAYNGSGSITVGLDVENGTSYFGGWGTNLIRGCYYGSCVPQTATNLRLRVFNGSGVSHTIQGHGKA